MFNPVTALELRAPPNNKASKRRKVNLRDSPASSSPPCPTMQNEVTTDGVNEGCSAQTSKAAQMPKKNRGFRKNEEKQKEKKKKSRISKSN